MGEWVERVHSGLSEELIYNNKLVMWGLFYAIEPDRSWSSFKRYLEYLSGQDANQLRDRIFGSYKSFKLLDDGSGTGSKPEKGRINTDTSFLLSNKQAFLDYLRERFPKSSLDIDIEFRSHELLNDPPAMKSLIINHLSVMWESTLAPEWKKIEPMLKATVEAFRESELSNYSVDKAIKVILNKQVDSILGKNIDDYDRIIFVPSSHLGPYTSKYKCGDSICILFGARMPEGFKMSAPGLNRSDILVRVNALADDVRLRILKLLLNEGELRSQEIIEKLVLSQSAASRHLKQLSATGYISERRCAGAKCYELNRERIGSSLKAISSYLLGED